MGGLLRASGMRSSDMATQAPVLIIEAGSSPLGKRLSDLWDYRELLYFLAWKDFKVRYKQTILGVAWAIIQPFFTMVRFSIFFGYLGKSRRTGFHTLCLRTARSFPGHSSPMRSLNPATA